MLERKSGRKVFALPKRCATTKETLLVFVSAMGSRRGTAARIKAWGRTSTTVERRSAKGVLTEMQGLCSKATKSKFFLLNLCEVERVAGRI